MKSLSPEAQRILDDYMRRLARALHPLREPDRHEIFCEIQSHIHERLEQNTKAVLEAEDVLAALYRLGEPSSYVSLYLTDAYLQKGFERRSPGLVLKGVLRWLGATALSYLYSFPFFLLYLVSFLLLPLGVMKAIAPDHVGIFYATITEEGKPKQYVAVGFSMGRPLDKEGQEIMRDWFAPMSISGGVFVGLGATVLLRWMTRRLLVKRHGL